MAKAKKTISEAKPVADAASLTAPSPIAPVNVANAAATDLAAAVNSSDTPPSEAAGGTGDTAGPADLSELDLRYPLLVAARVAFEAKHPDYAGPIALRITAKIDGFRRAGMAHPSGSVDHDPTLFTADQVEALFGEPRLVAEIVPATEGA